MYENAGIKTLEEALIRLIQGAVFYTEYMEEMYYTGDPSDGLFIVNSISKGGQTQITDEYESIESWLVRI